TTVFRTHHYLEKAEEADRICIIDKGKVVSFGTPDDIKRDLVEEYVLVDATDRSALRDELSRLGHAANGGPPFEVQLNGHTVHSILRSIETPLSVVKTHTPTLEDAYLEIVSRTAECGLGHPGARTPRVHQAAARPPADGRRLRMAADHHQHSPHEPPGGREPPRRWRGAA